MAENFPRLGKDLDMKVFEAKRSPQFHHKTIFSRRIIMKNCQKSKSKERILKAAWGKECNLHRTLIWLFVSQQKKPYKFPQGTTEYYTQSAERKKPTSQEYSIQQSYPLEMNKNTFLDKQKRKFITRRPALQEMLKGVL